MALIFFCIFSLHRINFFVKSSCLPQVPHNSRILFHLRRPDDPFFTRVVLRLFSICFGSRTPALAPPSGWSCPPPLRPPFPPPYTHMGCGEGATLAASAGALCSRSCTRGPRGGEAGWATGLVKRIRNSPIKKSHILRRKK